jgi:hypothetical protein
MRGKRWMEADIRCIEGDLMLAQGDATAAEACWRRGIDIACAQGAASWHLRAATRLAHLLAILASKPTGVAAPRKGPLRDAIPRAGLDQSDMPGRACSSDRRQTCELTIGALKTSSVRNRTPELVPLSWRR